MTVVYVHGVPETPTLWGPLRSRIGGDSVALRLPGFGSPRPAAMRTKEDYAAWLADQVRAVGEPVDLVGHDWGGHLVLRIVSGYDVPVRSWVSDVLNAWHPAYEWHDGATVLQGEQGDEFIAALRRPAGSFSAFLEPLGVTPELMREIDEIHDVPMSEAILALYRTSTPNFHADWGSDLSRSAEVPGLAVIAEDDPYGDDSRTTELADQLNARVARLPGLSHYWMLQDPDRAAEELQTFWASTR